MSEEQKKQVKGTATGMAAGLNKGFIVTRRQQPLKPSKRKGKLGKRVDLVRSIIREVAGLAPYEKRLIELTKGGGVNAQKRALKFAKKRLGTHYRAKRKAQAILDLVSKAHQ